MSSAISTSSKALSQKGGSAKSQKKSRRDEMPDQRDSRGGQFQGDEDDAPESGFHVGHFFVLLSLMAATLAVVVSRESRPETLILISMTIGAAGAAGVSFYRMLAPLAASDAELVTEPVSERLRGDLEREKMLVLRSIKELEFDRAMGKLSPQDFEEMAGRLRSRALGIIKQLDEGGEGYRALIEKELQARLGTNLAGRVAVSAPQQVAPSAAVAVAEAPPAAIVLAGLCECGVQNDKDARFCKSCGSRLS